MPTHRITFEHLVWISQFPFCCSKNEVREVLRGSPVSILWGYGMLCLPIWLFLSVFLFHRFLTFKTIYQSKQNINMLIRINKYVEIFILNISTQEIYL